MAGIGFKLKKLLVQQGYISNAAAYFYSSIVIVGPMLICISIILLAKFYMKRLGIANLDIETLTATIVYCFVFSMLLTGGLAFVSSRYISDCLFSNKLNGILDSYYTMQMITSVVAAVAAAGFLFQSPLEYQVKLCTYLLFTVLSLIWIDMTYVSAFKEYNHILSSFFTGFISMIVLALVAVNLLDMPEYEVLLFCIMIGFVILHLMLSVSIRRFYKPVVQNTSSFSIIEFFKPHSVLFATGSLLAAATYVHNFVFWISAGNTSVAHTYQYYPNYDIPSFYAILTVIPSIVLFVVSMETNFYTKYKNYFFLVLNEGISHEIKLAKKEMEETLFHELSRMMEIQLLITFMSIVVGINVLAELGFTSQFINCFTSLSFGSYVYIFFYINVLVLMYFDDKWGTFAMAASYFSLNIILSQISIAFGPSYYGYGYFVSGLFCLIGGMLRVNYYIKNIDYYTYCKQRLVESKPAVDALTKENNLISKKV